MILAKQKFCVV